MGVNEIRDGLDSLLTERLANIRRVQRREGEASGGGGREFQQLFEFASRENNGDEKNKEEKPTQVASPPPPVARARALTPEEIEEAKKSKEPTPGLLIDVEA